MGSSRPWPEAMNAITGQDRMDASAFREYFKPLEMWLIAKNKELEEPIGWSTGKETSCSYFKESLSRLIAIIVTKTDGLNCEHTSSPTTQASPSREKPNGPINSSPKFSLAAIWTVVFVFFCTVIVI